MQVVEVLNPLAREFKSIETLRKELAELQQELAKAHNQVCYWNIETIQYHHLELEYQALHVWCRFIYPKPECQPRSTS